MEFTTKFGLGEIVIRESHKNGVMVQERMMEVINISVGKDPKGDVEVGYFCEDTQNGHRQVYTENMLVGDPTFDQQKGKYMKEIDSSETNYEEKS